MIFLVFAGLDGEAGYKLLDDTDDGQLGNLTCFSCYLNVHKGYCLTLEDKSRPEIIQRCHPGEYYCKVSSLKYSIVMSYISIRLKQISKW